MNIFDFMEGYIRSKDIDHINNFYTSSIKKLNALYEEHGEGQTRKETGNIFQDLFFELTKTANSKLVLKKNDFLTIHSKTGKYKLSNIQVDWHVYLEDKLLFVCECKAHLDRCFLSRAVSDIKDIRKIHSDVPAIIFCGQRHISEDALNYYKEECQFESFFVNVDKRRSSKTPLYKTHNDLDIHEIECVYNHIKSLTTGKSSI